MLICDFEVKTTPVLPQVDAGLDSSTPRYFAVMGALATRTGNLGTHIGGAKVSRLACQHVFEAAGLADAFIGGLMPSPGIDPPLGLR